MEKIVKNKALRLILPMLITLAVLMCVAAIKQVVPFGDNRLLLCDMPVAELPGLFRQSNILHGEAGLFYDWFLSSGTERDSLLGFLNPITIILSLFPQSLLTDATTLWVVLNFLHISFTAGLFFQKMFPSLAYPWQLILTLLYTMSGYTLRYYTNVSFLMAVAVLPLLLLALNRLFTKGKYLTFILCMTYLLITNSYFSFFTAIFLILTGGLYVFCFFEKDARRLAATRLGTGMASSLFVSAGLLLPSLANVLSGARFSMTEVLLTGDAGSAGGEATGVFGTLKTIYLTENINDPNKAFMLLSIEGTVVALLLLLVRFRQDKKRVIFFVGSGVMLLLPILFENINLMWHGGSYNGYSVRFGYILVLMLLCAFGYYLKSVDSARDGKEKKAVFFIAKSVFVYGSLILSAVYLLLCKSQLTKVNTLLYRAGPLAESIVITYSKLFLCIAVLFFAIQLFSSKKLRNAFTAAVLCSLLLFNAVWHFASFDVKNSRGSSLFTDVCSELAEEIPQDNMLVRVADKNSTLFMNYPTVLRRSSLGAWNHFVDNGTKRAHALLGYTSYYTVLCDTGGTAFSDTLLGIRDFLFNEEPVSGVYTYNKELSNGYSLYSLKSELPFGSLFTDGLTQAEYSENAFEYQNGISSSLQNGAELFSPTVILARDDSVQGEDTGLRRPDTGDAIIDYHSVREYTLSVPSGDVLYFSIADAEAILAETVTFYKYNIKVNGETLTIHSYLGMGEQTQTTYPAFYNSSVICLGSFDSEEVTIEIEFSTNKKEETLDFDEFAFYTMDTNAFDTMCNTAYTPVTDYSASGRQITINTDGDRSGWLFVPIRYSEDWNAKADGEPCEIKKVLGAYCAIYYEAGTSEIEMSYTPSGAIRNWLTVLIAAVITAMLFLLARKKGFVPSRRITGLFLVALIAVFAVVLTMFYILPLGAQVYMLFT